MILRSSPPSPFGRKVKIAAKVAGVFDELEVLATDTLDPKDSIRSQNPLGKIPALVLPDGDVLYDSRVICAYIGAMKPDAGLYPTGADRWKALRLEALADGITDAAILQVYEKRFRPEGNRDADWVAYQAEKVTRSLSALSAAVPEIQDRPHIGHITLACALGYQDFRFDGVWRSDYPELVEWLDRFAAMVPAFEETKPPAA